MLLRWFDSFWAALVVALAIFALATLTQEPRHPEADEYRYLTNAQQLVDHGVFAREPTHKGPAEPTSEEAPVTPHIIALIMLLDENTNAAIDCALNAYNFSDADLVDCPNTYGTFHLVQIVLMAFVVSLIWLTAKYCGTSAGVRWLALGLALLSEQHFYFLPFFLTENYLMLFMAVFLVGVARAYRVDEEPTDRLLSLAIAGAGLGLCALTREGYTPLGFAMPVALLLCHLWIRRRDGGTRSDVFKPVMAFVAAYVLVLSPWLIRNFVLFDSLAIVNGHGSNIIIERVSYNTMTWAEWMAAWVFWLPDFGDKLGPALFGAETVERMRWWGQDSFYSVGIGPLRAELKAEAAAAGQPVTSYVIQTYILGDLLNHIRVTFVLVWRGLWVGDYFGLLTQILAVFGALALIRSGRGHIVLVLVMPALFMVGLHGFVSSNIPRYNLIMIPYLSILSAMVIASWFRRRR